jgi:hypothetical protein
MMYIRTEASNTRLMETDKTFKKVQNGKPPDGIRTKNLDVS